MNFVFAAPPSRKEIQVQTALDNLIKVEPIPRGSTFQIREELCDLTLIAADGTLRVESSLLCRASEVFFRMLTSEMKEGQTRQIRLTDYSLETLRRVYRFYDPIPLFLRSSGLPQEESQFVEMLLFAHAYSFQELLWTLKRVILGQEFITGCNGKARTSQLYFDLDQKLDLGLRRHLFKAIFDGYRHGQLSEGITDVKIYFELANLIFKKSPVLEESQSFWLVERAFLESFRRSGCDAWSLVTPVKFDGLFYFSERLTSALLETVADPEVRAALCLFSVYDQQIKTSRIDDQKKYFVDLQKTQIEILKKKRAEFQSAESINKRARVEEK